MGIRWPTSLISLVRCMGNRENGFLHVDEVPILAVFAFKHEHGAGNLGQERPWVITNAA